MGGRDWWMVGRQVAWSVWHVEASRQHMLAEIMMSVDMVV